MPGSMISGMKPAPTWNLARLMMLAMLPVEPNTMPTRALRKSVWASSMPAMPVLSLKTMSCQSWAAAFASGEVR